MIITNTKNPEIEKHEIRATSETIFEAVFKGLRLQLPGGQVGLCAENSIKVTKNGRLVVATEDQDKIFMILSSKDGDIYVPSSQEVAVVANNGNFVVVAKAKEGDVFKVCDAWCIIHENRGIWLHDEAELPYLYDSFDEVIPDYFTDPKKWKKIVATD